MILSEFSFSGYHSPADVSVILIFASWFKPSAHHCPKGVMPARPGCLMENSVLIYKLVNGFKGTQTCIKICLRQELEVNFQLILSCKCHLSKYLGLFLFSPFFLLPPEGRSLIRRMPFCFASPKECNCHIPIIIFTRGPCLKWLKEFNSLQKNDVIQHPSWTVKPLSTNVHLSPFHLADFTLFYWERTG